MAFQEITDLLEIRENSIYYEKRRNKQHKDLLPNCNNCKFLAACPTERIEEADGYCIYYEKRRNKQHKDLLPNCNNCKFLAACPTEWIEEAGGYCEYWETNAT